jgi:hypothetical protein
MSDFRNVLSKPPPELDDAALHEGHAARLSGELVSLLSADKFDACVFVSTLAAYVDQKVAVGLALHRKGLA